MRCGAERSGASGSDDECEDTPSRHHATTTPSNPSPPQRTTTHVTTQLKTLIFLIFFLIRLRYRPFSIGEIISHVLWLLTFEPEFL